MRLLTFGGAERFSTAAGPAARLADIYDQLMAERRAGRLGLPVLPSVRADAVLPDGRLLSGASAEEMAPGPPRAPPAGLR